MSGGRAVAGSFVCGAVRTAGGSSVIAFMFRRATGVGSRAAGRILNVGSPVRDSVKAAAERIDEDCSQQGACELANHSMDMSISPGVEFVNDSAGLRSAQRDRSGLQ